VQHPAFPQNLTATIADVESAPEWFLRATGWDADAFAKGGNDFNLLFAGKVVHEAHPSS
jgi:hypothetical protein